MGPCRHLAVSLLGLVLSSSGASASDYPTRPIKFVVPFTAGSATDAVARIFGEKVSATLKQPVVVENMPGASGVIAAQNVARAKPDGYTILITTNTTHGANQSLLARVPYDAVADFEPITQARRHPAHPPRHAVAAGQQRCPS